ncbi:MAG TPA: GTP 3',8-cyclase MoaA [Accumulibacter sp.]|uniref:GTP 3',8-cyclase MoaA n=1 Tax=Accumulibacter sp. TaxID=2053492 RepID=UPI0025E5346A|nr:GTP 3',8-cyclase MoaA [Accumulibacter sp.]MCM8599516.1 GTP 3',8-cyclase MoaA [Accumulibacter sp.]MCM8662424.1 GTP 3',8-cyclase MoaA [Accumulibacter sp.]HNC52131.1 GTP 3',8-cyclase MoaA [Accumulibacter sp.]
MRNESSTPEAVPAVPLAFPQPTSPVTARHADGTLIDRYGRHVTYLRLSVTDRCDFRCGYCMAEEMSFLPRAQVLTLEECLRVARAFVDLGVSKVRVTGGEPLVRHDVVWLLERLARLPGLRELVITTNGSQLERFAAALCTAGVRRINVSLDTLRADRFREITRVGDLAKVLRGLAAAQAAGFERLKLNTVMMRGRNDDELLGLVEFAVERGMDIAFIEEMPLGEIGHGRQTSYFSSEEALARLQTRFRLLPSTETTGGPARYWRIPDTATRVGFISPHSHNFCDSCNRVRVTARGELYPCLGNNDASQLLPLLRAHPTDDTALRTAIVRSMGIKAKGHDFGNQMDAPQVIRFMSMTGG